MRVTVTPDAAGTPGTLDLGFGNSGVVTVGIGVGDDNPTRMLVQPDGKIVMAGYTTIESYRDFVVLRFLADGTLDPGRVFDLTLPLERGMSFPQRPWCLVVLAK